jgi:KRAB domain-containing zinc finger protein
MKIVRRNVPFQCTKCPKHYWTKCAFKAHVNVSHDKVKRYRCYFCSLAIFSESKMIQHMSNHTQEKPFKCHYCFQWYRKEESVNRHKNGRACNRKLRYPSVRPCYFCHKVLSNNPHLMEHMKTVHLKEDFKRCNLCCKYFSSAAAINRHARSVHLFEKYYKCQLCSKTLCSNGDLNHHIRSVHTKEKPFKCYFCSTSFVNFVALKLHTWIHTREKPITCYFCKKDFSVVKHLSDHIKRFHTKERPFKCMQCPSHYYATKGDLNQHTRIKHGYQ